MEQLNHVSITTRVRAYQSNREFNPNAPLLYQSVELQVVELAIVSWKFPREMPQKTLGRFNCASFALNNPIFIFSVFHCCQLQIINSTHS
jgi:hypothetical protein